MQTTSVINWTRKGEVISLELRSNGYSGEEWIHYLPSLGYNISKNAQAILRSREFVPTPSGTLHQVRIVRSQAFMPISLYTEKICEFAALLKWRAAHPEVAPLMRAALPDNELQLMGLVEIATFHHPINGRFLDIDELRLESAPASPKEFWHSGHGFGFEV